MVYGMKLYDLFLDNEAMFKYFIKDKGIPFFICEHKKIMKDRVQFLNYKNHIREKYIADVGSLANVLLEKGELLLTKCMKYQYFPKEKYKNDVVNALIELKNIENEFYPRLIESLY